MNQAPNMDRPFWCSAGQDFHMAKQRILEYHEIYQQIWLVISWELHMIMLYLVGDCENPGTRNTHLFCNKIPPCPILRLLIMNADDSSES